VEVAAAAGKSVFCEKPLALTLEEADRMIDATQRNDVALGVDYVMRFQPAYRFLEGLAASALAGNVRSISFQNFAQHLPAGHWFWNREQSGGILVEHGVHFFDSYGRIAGLPVKCAALQPSRESIEVAVWYKAAPEIPDGAARTAVGRYYHEFAFPGEMEYAQGVVMFDRGRLEIRGWIPTSLSGAVEGDARQLRQVGSEAGVDLTVAPDGRVARFDASFPHRQEQYASAVLAGMRDVILRHRDPAHQMTVSVEDARRSLDVALAAQRSADAEAPEAFWRYTD
jgi:predicted dehydrogenase